MIDCALPLDVRYLPLLPLVLVKLPVSYSAAAAANLPDNAFAPLVRLCGYASPYAAGLLPVHCYHCC